MAHSPKSPSGFARIRACAGSLRMQKGIPDKENVYAAKGTAAHALGEKCLQVGAKPEDFMGQKFGEFKFDDGRVEEFIVDGEMCDAVNVYVDHCRPLTLGRYKIEQRVQLPFLGKDESGTADFISVHEDILHVVDYKNGIGLVEAFENIQGLCYGLGAAIEMENLPWKILRITIVQPNAFHPDGPVRSWDMPREDLFDWKMDLAEASVLADDPNAPLNAGSHCGWCKAKAVCKEYKNYCERTVRMDFESPNAQPVNPDMLTDEEIYDLIFEKIPVIEKWCAALKDYAQQRAEEKNPVEGTKLVATRATRKWKDAKAAEAAFGHLEGAYKKTFVTAPQMEKIIGKKEFAKYESQYVEKTSTGVTLVPISDKREAVRPLGSSEFGAVSIEDKKPAKQTTTAIKLF